MNRILKRGLIGTIISILLIGLDQFTKALAVTYLKNQPNIILLKGIFELEYLENTSAAFGMDPISFTHRIFQFNVFNIIFCFQCFRNM